MYNRQQVLHRGVCAAVLLTTIFNIVGMECVQYSEFLSLPREMKSSIACDMQMIGNMRQVCRQCNEELKDISPEKIRSTDSQTVDRGIVAYLKRGDNQGASYLFQHSAQNYQDELRTYLTTLKNGGMIVRQEDIDGIHTLQNDTIDRVRSIFGVDFMRVHSNPTAAVCRAAAFLAFAQQIDTNDWQKISQYDFFFRALLKKLIKSSADGLPKIMMDLMPDEYVNWEDDGGKRLLNRLCWSHRQGQDDYREALAMLLQKHGYEQLSVTNERGETILHNLACVYDGVGSDQLLDYFLSMGECSRFYSMKDNDGNTPFDVAYNSCNQQKVEIFAKYGISNWRYQLQQPKVFAVAAIVAAVAGSVLGGYLQQ